MNAQDNIRGLLTREDFERNEKVEYQSQLPIQRVGMLKHHILGQSYDQIGAANGFVLHSGHLHLNETGAAMVAGLIEGFVTE